MIENVMEGELVPAEVIAELLQQAMQESGDDKFLIDRFPRSEDNRAAFKYTTGIEPEFVVYYDCSEAEKEKEKEKRILGRNQGRADDNIVMLRKRFKVFEEDSLPAVEYYESMGKVHKVDAGNPIDEVFEEFEAIFSS